MSEEENQSIPQVFFFSLTSNYDASIQSYYSDENDYKRNGMVANSSTEENLFQWGLSSREISSESFLSRAAPNKIIFVALITSPKLAQDPEETGMDRVLACPIFDMRPFIDEKATKPNGSFLDYIFYSNEGDIYDDEDNLVTTFDWSKVFA